VTTTGDSHVELTRRALVGFLREQAEWRAWKAEERPEDPRNARSAEQLLDLAEHVAVLPVEDERLRLLAMVHSGDADVLRPGSEAARLAGCYGFEREEHGGTWLRVFVETAVSATVEAVDDERRWL
jgi:hypothetical protein